jgi:hypothetical protein
MAKVAYIWQNLQPNGSNCLQMQQLSTHGNTCLQMAAAIAYSGMKFPPMTTVDCKRQMLRTHIATGAYTWQHLLTNGSSS